MSQPSSRDSDRLRRSIAAYVAFATKLSLAIQALVPRFGPSSQSVFHLLSVGAVMARNLQRSVVVTVVGARLVRKASGRRRRPIDGEDAEQVSPQAGPDAAARAGTEWEEVPGSIFAASQIESQPFTLARALPSVVAVRQSAFRTVASMNGAIERVVAGTAHVSNLSRAVPSETVFGAVARGEPEISLEAQGKPGFAPVSIAERDLLPEVQGTAFAGGPSALAASASFRQAASSTVFALNSYARDITSLATGIQAPGAVFAPQPSRALGQRTAFDAIPVSPFPPSPLSSTISGSVDTSFKSPAQDRLALGLPTQASPGPAQSAATNASSGVASFQSETAPAARTSLGTGVAVGADATGQAGQSPEAPRTTSEIFATANQAVAPQQRPGLAAQVDLSSGLPRGLGDLSLSTGRPGRDVSINAGPYAVPRGFSTAFESQAFNSARELSMQVGQLASATPLASIPLRATPESQAASIAPDVASPAPAASASYPPGAASMVSRVVASLGLGQVSPLPGVATGDVPHGVSTRPALEAGLPPQTGTGLEGSVGVQLSNRAPLPDLVAQGNEPESAATSLPIERAAAIGSPQLKVLGEAPSVESTEFASSPIAAKTESDFAFEGPRTLGAQWLGAVSAPAAIGLAMMSLMTSSSLTAPPVLSPRAGLKARDASAAASSTALQTRQGLVAAEVPTKAALPESKGTTVERAERGLSNLSAQASEHQGQPGTLFQSLGLYGISGRDGVGIRPSSATEPESRFSLAQVPGQETRLPSVWEMATLLPGILTSFSIPSATSREQLSAGAGTPNPPEFDAGRLLSRPTSSSVSKEQVEAGAETPSQTVANYARGLGSAIEGNSSQSAQGTALRLADSVRGVILGAYSGLVVGTAQAMGSASMGATQRVQFSTTTGSLPRDMGAAGAFRSATGAPGNLVASSFFGGEVPPPEGFEAETIGHASTITPSQTAAGEYVSGHQEGGQTTLGTRPFPQIPLVAAAASRSLFAVRMMAQASRVFGAPSLPTPIAANLASSSPPPSTARDRAAFGVSASMAETEMSIEQTLQKKTSRVPGSILEGPTGEALPRVDLSADATTGVWGR